MTYYRYNHKTVNFDNDIVNHMFSYDSLIITHLILCHFTVTTDQKCGKVCEVDDSERGTA